MAFGSLALLLLNLALNVSAAPLRIDYQPQSQTVILYQPVAFGVIASGTAPFAYQWRKAGVPMVGETNGQIVLAHPHFSDASAYSVVVSNVEGEVISADAGLTVRPPAAGDIDFSFAEGSSINSSILTMAQQSDGKLLIGGSFTAAGGMNRGGIARLNTDGRLDSGFNQGSGISGIYCSEYCLYPYVWSMAVQGDGTVLFGGWFRGVNGAARRGIARLNADGSLDTGFQAGLSSPDDSISAIAQQGDGKVIIGGRFNDVGGKSRTNLARLNTDGMLDSSFQNVIFEPAFPGNISTVSVQSDGKVLIGGWFTKVNGVARTGVARLNQDGSLDESFQNGASGASAAVGSIATQKDGKVLIGGEFVVMVNGIYRFGLARLNADGSLDTAFASGLPVGGKVFSMAIQNDGKVIIGGNFNRVNGVTRNFIARLNADGSLETNFQNGLSGANGAIRSVVVQSDGKVLMGGIFTSVNDVPAAYLVRIWGNTDIPAEIKSITRIGGDVDLIWYAVSNRTYRVQYNESLSTTNWMELAGDVPATRATADKTDTTRAGATQRFYRVVLLP